MSSPGLNGAQGMFVFVVMIFVTVWFTNIVMRAMDIFYKPRVQGWINRGLEKLEETDFCAVDEASCKSDPASDWDDDYLKQLEEELMVLKSLRSYRTLGTKRGIGAKEPKVRHEDLPILSSIKQRKSENDPNRFPDFISSRASEKRGGKDLTRDGSGGGGHLGATWEKLTRHKDLHGRDTDGERNGQVSRASDFPDFPRAENKQMGEKVTVYDNAVGKGGSCCGGSSSSNRHGDKCDDGISEEEERCRHKNNDVGSFFQILKSLSVCLYGEEESWNDVDVGHFRTVGATFA